MSMVVRSNINSMNANRNLGINNSQVAKAIEKLASGYAINRAADDASGLAITEKMQAQITGLDQGTDNALEGIGLVQTAEGAMSEIHDMLNRIVELSTKSANGTIQDEVDREAVQAEVDVLVDEIDRIAQSTNYNGIDLLNGNLSDGGLVIKTNTYTETITTENTTCGSGSTDGTGGTDGTAGNDSVELNIAPSPITTVGSFTITGGVEGTDFSYNTSTGALTILTDTHMRIDGNGIATTTESILVSDSAGSANLALKDINITNATGSAFYTGNNKVYIELEGSNELTSTYGGNLPTSYGSAGLNVGANGSITIDGTGELTATGGYYSAGIGSDYQGASGNITIDGGTITANGGFKSAGIGSGGDGTVGDITINGGDINTIGGTHGSGIGSGNYGIAGDITINGGSVIATVTDNDGTGIGAGDIGIVGNITITGGDINATGGTNCAGIGGGGAGTVGDIIITGGDITVTGGGWGAGIGSGYYGKMGDITVTGGDIIVTGVYLGAGIGSGSGCESSAGDITITGGDITVIGGFGGAGIGSGYESSAGDITITGGNITANGGEYGAGIGTGYDGIVGNIIYVEEIVAATGGADLYGFYPEDVGAGVFGTVGTITTIPLQTTDTNTDCETTYTTIVTTVEKTEVYNGDGLILHVADQNETYNKIRVYIDPMTGEALKIKPLYVDTQELAGAAINIVKDAINYVSTNRCNVGALQNRLEHTINGNNSTSENMTSAKSRIKDADMAKEMTEYTKMNVLTQASQAMLAQSNQSTQQVLSLLE